MRKIFIITLLVTCSIFFVSCESITAQNINTDSISSMNSDPNMQNDPGSKMNLSNKNMNSDIIGKIISVDGNLITLEMIEQTETNKTSNSNDEKQNTIDKQNNNNRKSKRYFSLNRFKINFTGDYKTLEVNTDADIWQESSMGSQNENNTSKSTVKISDLKKDQIIMIWYKENTEIVDKICVVQL